MLKADYMLTQVRGCVGGQLGWCLGPRWQAPASQIWNNPLQNFQSFPGPADSAVHPLPLLLSPPPPGYWCMVLWTTISYQVLCCRASVFRHVDWIITISLFSSFNSHPSHGYAKSLKVAKTNWQLICILKVKFSFPFYHKIRAVNSNTNIGPSISLTALCGITKISLKWLCISFSWYTSVLLCFIVGN